MHFRANTGIEHLLSVIYMQQLPNTYMLLRYLNRVILVKKFLTDMIIYLTYLFNDQFV